MSTYKKIACFSNSRTRAYVWLMFFFLYSWFKLIGYNQHFKLWHFENIIEHFELEVLEKCLREVKSLCFFTYIVDITISISLYILINYLFYYGHFSPHHNKNCILKYLNQMYHCILKEDHVHASSPDALIVMRQEHVQTLL